jgi:hypothetical protein
MNDRRLKELSKLVEHDDVLRHVCADDVRDLVSEVDRLRGALRAFLKLSWTPDSVPGPNFYVVDDMKAARSALQTAGLLVDGRSPFQSDNDGSLMVFVDFDGTRRRSVWFGGHAYSEDRPELVPDQHRAAFRTALETDAGEPS